jgi:hypothetical protein
MKAAARHRATPAVRDPEALSPDEVRRLAKAERKRVSPDRAQAAAGQREVREIERRHAERVESQGLAARLAETSSLALSRGEAVTRESVRIATPLLDDHGARVVSHGLPLYRQETVTRVRVASRGGLQLAFERGDLDGGRVRADRLYETGKAYRWAFEVSAAMTTPARELSPISGRSPLRASAGPQDAVFAAGERLRGFRLGLTEAQRAVVDRVCGLDMSVRAAALSLKVDPRTLRRVLLEALCAATEARASAAPPPGSDRRPAPAPARR